MKSTSKLGRDGRFWGLLMIAPTILGLMILNIIPFFQTIYMSFSKTKAFGAYQFCGMENYLEMFRNAEFWKANWNSIYFCILTVPVGVFLALIVAVLLNAKIKGKTAFRAICPASRTFPSPCTKPPSWTVHPRSASSSALRCPWCRPPCLWCSSCA